MSVLRHVHHLCADQRQTEELNADFQASLCPLTKPGVGAKIVSSHLHVTLATGAEVNRQVGQPTSAGGSPQSWSPCCCHRIHVGRSAPKLHLHLQGCVQCNKLSWVKRSSLNWQMVTNSAIVIEIYMADEHIQGSLKALFL